MTTNKNRINAYLSNEAFEAFKKFCQQQQVKSHSSGVEFLIKQFLIEGNLSSQVSASVTKNELERTIALLRNEFQTTLGMHDQLEKLMGKLIA